MYYIIELYDEDLDGWFDHSQHNSIDEAAKELSKLILSGKQARIVKSKNPIGK